jgi:hypothetical protein
MTRNDHRSPKASFHKELPCISNDQLTHFTDEDADDRAAKKLSPGHMASHQEMEPEFGSLDKMWLG